MDENTFRYDIKGLCEDIGVPYEDIASLFSEYFSEMKDNIQECKTLYINRDWMKLEREVHNMKGISVNLNVTDVYNTCTTLDYQLRTYQYENINTNLEKIYELYNAAENDIREFFKLKDIMI